MKRWFALTFMLVAQSITGSAQITNSYGQTSSITGLLSHLLGIEIYEPYQVLGITATLGVLWVSTYVIFKVGIKKIDDGIDNNGVGRKSGLANALGIDDSESTNVLAILTLLIVLTMIGTGAFMGVIRGWQTLILLTFTISILAGLIFVLVGGAGGIIGGAKIGRGLGKQMNAAGMEQVAKAEERIAEAEKDIREAEKKVEEAEASAEEEIDEEDEERAEKDAIYTEEEIEQIIAALEDAVDGLGSLTGEEIRELAEAVENLEEIIDLLETD